LPVGLLGLHLLLPRLSGETSHHSTHPSTSKPPIACRSSCAQADVADGTSVLRNPSIRRSSPMGTFDRTGSTHPSFLSKPKVNRVRKGTNPVGSDRTRNQRSVETKGRRRGCTNDVRRGRVAIHGHRFDRRKRRATRCHGRVAAHRRCNRYVHDATLAICRTWREGESESDPTSVRRIPNRCFRARSKHDSSDDYMPDLQRQNLWWILNRPCGLQRET